MPQEREYTGQSLNRVDAINQRLIQDHRRIENNKQIIDNYVLANPTKIHNPDVISKGDIIHSQDINNIEEATRFSQEHLHELVDIALSDAAKAGKTIIDARDFGEPQSEEVAGRLSEGFDIPSMPGKQGIVEARQQIVERYCAEKDVNQSELTLSDLSEIRSLPEWKDPSVN